MAGTLTLTTLSDGTNSTSATNCIQGSAKAWVNFDGSATPSIRGSFNVSSITYRTTSQYTVNLTTALADTNFAVTAGVLASSANSYNNAGVCQVDPRATLTTTAIPVRTYDTVSGQVNYGTIYVVAFSS